MPKDPQIRDQLVNGQQVSGQVVKLTKTELEEIKTEEEPVFHLLVAGGDLKDGLVKELVMNGKMVTAVEAKNVVEEESFRQQTMIADMNGSISPEHKQCETPSSKILSSAEELPGDLAKDVVSVALVLESPQDPGFNGPVHTDVTSPTELDGSRQRYTKTKGDLKKQLQMKKDLKMQETQPLDVVDPGLPVSSASSTLSQSLIVPATQVCF